MLETFEIADSNSSSKDKSISEVVDVTSSAVVTFEVVAVTSSSVDVVRSLSALELLIEMPLNISKS